MASGNSSPVHHTVEFDWTLAESPSAAVVQAVSREKGVDPTDIEPLFGTVDPDALNALFKKVSSESRSYVQFSYEGFDVVVDADGSGSLFDQSADSAATASTSSNQAVEGAE